MLLQYKGALLDSPVPNAQNLPQLNSAVAECMTAMSANVLLQQNLFKQGVLFHLVQYLFNYDYTLEEGGVEKSKESNQQVRVYGCPSVSFLDSRTRIDAAARARRRWRTDWRFCARVRLRRSAAGAARWSSRTSARRFVRS